MEIINLLSWCLFVSFHFLESCVPYITELFISRTIMFSFKQFISPICIKSCFVNIQSLDFHQQKWYFRFQSMPFWMSRATIQAINCLHWESDPVQQHFFYHDSYILVKHIIFNTIGSTPGAYDVKIFETLSPQASYSVSHTVDSTTYPAPYKFYTTVRCYNTIGLFTWVSVN